MDPSSRCRVTFGMPFTIRLESTLIDTLIDEVKNSDGIFLLPKSALVMILNDKKVLHTWTHKLSIKVTTSTGCVIEDSNTEATNNNNSNLSVTTRVPCGVRSYPSKDMQVKSSNL